MYGRDYFQHSCSDWRDEGQSGRLGNGLCALSTGRMATFAPFFLLQEDAARPGEFRMTAVENSQRQCAGIKNMITGTPKFDIHDSVCIRGIIITSCTVIWQTKVPVSEILSAWLQFVRGSGPLLNDGELQNGTDYYLSRVYFSICAVSEKKGRN